MEFEEVGYNISNSNAGEYEPAQMPLELLQSYDDTPQLSLNFRFLIHILC